jgi:ABC-type nickel/cobalt efflux system permease component RcnA
MFGLDDQIAELGTGGSLLIALAAALLLGLRHATDPDHLTALATLVLSGEKHRGAGRAGRLGLAWGFGHATTLIAFGLPVVVLHAALPAGAQRVAEAVVGVVIVALAVRLLVRWRRGYFHVHPHEHAGITHVHPHVHEGAHTHAHEHAHAEALGRTPRAAYGIGMVHGFGGSAGVGVLLIGAMPSRAVAGVALVLFAGATALSMASISAAWGGALTAEAIARRLQRFAPLFASASLAFGVWYGLAALS